MRKIFNKTLLEIARKDARIHLVLADIGYGEIEGFAKEFPDRYYNVGVAEQNMTAVACGLAMEGNICVTYSIANFPTLRCLEQIRNDVCYHNANVKIVIIGGGVSYGPLGVSHHSTEDIAIMRALPNVVVLVPCDLQEAESATHAMMEYEGPVYYRCGYKNERDIHHKPFKFEFGKSITVEDGDDATIIFCGPIGFEAQEAVIAARKKGINVRLISMHTVKPIDREAVITAAKETRKIITVEEHNLSGGLGSAVAEVLVDEGNLDVKVKRMAFPDVYVHEVGSQEWLRSLYNMDASAIEQEIYAICRT
ncbi:MAG: transketolase C-terminal domain-containing protein [Sphaerochaetaceae bacterium]|jgi:transketolase|nr:transketolase C-terminal domain-containing protein [Sphaerochaetaceae bacterium]MDD3366044.1 transketolase C-terminal domain-containing protein [Sphaerochaetaceae bacterium]MDD4218592.1 transketolase C-terminal domain-containing protein [Sphaerochaetaceae bacterium]MDY0371536.1 transketolase C-terminal domain-containing protein [Sphaerochaetaceae bacterium]